MTRSRILLSACVLCIALPAAITAQQPVVYPVPSGSVAERLGAKLLPSAPTEVELGHSVTAMLADPQKLVALGIKGMHEGARITITCIGPNRLRVEADEMEPVAQRATATVNVAADGSLTVVPDRPAPPQAKPPL